MLLTRRAAIGSALSASIFGAERVPDKTVVLTTDDSVKSHRTFAAPVLRNKSIHVTQPPFPSHIRGVVLRERAVRRRDNRSAGNVDGR